MTHHNILIVYDNLGLDYRPVPDSALFAMHLRLHLILNRILAFGARPWAYWNLQGKRPWYLLTGGGNVQRCEGLEISRSSKSWRRRKRIAKEDQRCLVLVLLGLGPRLLFT